MFNTTAAFFKSMLLPLFKIGLIIFLIFFGAIASAIIWQKIREKKEYKDYVENPVKRQDL